MKLYDEFDCKRVQPEAEEIALGRSPYRRDFGRLLHSPSFRRLQGKTQLFPGNESDFFRNRLTHSLEVAQIAKGVAQKINAINAEFTVDPINLDLVEFAGLAHDLGHPPFGHNGERALDQCMIEHGGFEGNAQTLRILSNGEKKVLRDVPGVMDFCGIAPNGTDRRLGLNLTYRSLAAILKYDKVIPLRRDHGAKLVKGYYVTEEQLVADIKRHVQGVEHLGSFKTIECQIMDLADDIAYSTYDLEDAMKGGFIHPMEVLAKIGDESLLKKLHAAVKEEVTDVTEQQVFDAVTDLLPMEAGNGNGLQSYTASKLIATNGVLRTEFFSELVGAFILSVYIEVPAGVRSARILVPRDTRIKIESMKHLSFLLTIMSPGLKVVEYRGEDVVKAIFDALNGDNGHQLLPDDLQLPYERLKTTDSKRRLICDFVAGMTDRYAVEFYSRLRAAGASIYKPL